MEGGNPGVLENARTTDELVKEQATLEIAQRIDLLRLATREEIENVMDFVREGTVGDFFLKLFTETREITEEAVKTAINKRNKEAGAEWTTILNGLRGNLNSTLGTKTTNTGLKLKIRKPDRIWRWESERVQEIENIPAEQKEKYTSSSKTSHTEALEIASTTKDKNTQCLLQILAHQTAGVRMTEIEEIFEETDVNINELIERINAEILAAHNTKIHIRNGIAIIGPINPRWAPIIVVNRTEATAKLIQRITDNVVAEIKTRLRDTETPKQKIERLQAALNQAHRDLEEALRIATEAQSKAQKAVAEAAKKAEATVRAAEEQVAAAEQVKGQLQKELDAAKQSIQTERIIASRAEKRAKEAERQAATAEEARASAVRALNRAGITQQDTTQRTEGPLRERIRTLETTERMALERARSAEAKLAAIKATNSVTPEELASLRQAASRLQQAETTLASLRSDVEKQRAALMVSRGEAATLQEQLNSLQPKAIEADTLREQIAALQGQIKEQQEMLELLTAPAQPEPPAQAPIQAPVTSTQPARPATPPQERKPAQQDRGYLYDIRTGEFEFPEDLRKAVAGAITLGTIQSGQSGELPRSAWRHIKNELSGRKGLQPHIHAERLRLHARLQKLGEEEGPISTAKVQAFLRELQQTQ